MGAEVPDLKNMSAPKKLKFLPVFKTERTFKKDFVY